MRIALVSPKGPLYRSRGGIFRKSLRYAPLTLTTLAAYVPEELGASVELLDEGIADVEPEAIRADLAGITAITGNAPRAYELADRLRARGVTVVLGGPHPTLLPDEAQAHADAVVTGYAEQTWPALLRDFAARRLRPRYEQGPDHSLAGLPFARRDLLPGDRYFTRAVFEATRSCAHDCEFCVAPTAWGRKQYQKPVEDVVADVRQWGAGKLLFVDLNLVSDPRYAARLFEALVPLGIRWYGLATTLIALDRPLLELAARSGCRGLLMGLESVCEASLGQTRKGFNDPGEYREMVADLHRHHIALMGCFAFGLDGDTPDIFEKTARFAVDAAIDLPRFAIVTPFPSTPLHRRLEAEGRILSRDWSLYDAQHVVFRPKQMTAGAAAGRPRARLARRLLVPLDRLAPAAGARRPAPHAGRQPRLPVLRPQPAPLLQLRLVPRARAGGARAGRRSAAPPPRGRCAGRRRRAERTLRLTLVQPCIGRRPGERYLRTWQMEPLPLAVLAGLTPPGVELRVADDRFEPIPYDAPTDLVAISVETYTARRAYQIASEFRRRGVPVVMGGFHAMLAPDEVARHAESVVVGEAEALWPRVLDDWRHGRGERIYRAAERPTLAGARPDRRVFRGKRYLPIGLVEAGRGCPYHCEFCAIHSAYGQSRSPRPVDAVVQDVLAASAERRLVFIVDDNLGADVAASRELLDALARHRRPWVTQCSIQGALDEDWAARMAAAGCVGVLDRRLLQDVVVAGAGDVAAAGRHDPQHLAGLLAHGLRRAVDQHVVRVDRAVEEDLPAELGLERGQVHAAAAGLDRRAGRPGPAAIIAGISGSKPPQQCSCTFSR